MRKAKIKFLFGTIFLIILVLSIEAIYYGNDIVAPFPDGDEGKIECNIIEGAEFYFKSKAAAMSLFAEGESGVKSQFDFPSALSYTYTAIEYLQKAKSNYLKAFNLGNAVGYVENSRDILIGFDYDTFADELNLNKAIMERVKSYLGKGNVTGFYIQIATDIDEIIEILVNMRNDLEKNINPAASVYWRLLQRFSEATLFGNYGTMVGITAFSN